MDLRMKRTKKMLREALWDGIMERGFENLTVSEVCDRAMINRATFYRHYEDLNDLLLRGLDEIFDDLYALGEEPLAPEQFKEYTMESPPVNFSLFIDFFRERADFFRFMLSEKGVPALVTRLRNYMEEIVMARMRITIGPNHKPLIPLEILARGWAGQMMGLLIWWLEEAVDMPTEDIVHYLLSFLFMDMYESMGIGRPHIKYDWRKGLERANRRFYQFQNQAVENKCTR